MNLYQSLSNKTKLLLIVVFVLAFAVAPAFAQTPVPLVVDTNPMFVQANTWIVIFAPIVAIGVGISIALAILTFIGKQILDAFKG